MHRLVQQLDVPLPLGYSKIHVYTLKYANAEELLPVLADLVGGNTGSTGGSGSLNIPRGNDGTVESNVSAEVGPLWLRMSNRYPSTSPVPTTPTSGRGCFWDGAGIQ